MVEQTAGSKPQHFDIVIVGAGLVGASLAAAILAEADNRDLRVAIIDRDQLAQQPNDTSAEPPRFDPRVVALTASSQGLFERLGLWPLIQTKRACAYTQMRVWDDEGSGEIDFSAQELGVSHLGCIVENSLLLTELLRLLQYDSRLQFYRGHSLTSLELEQDPSVTHSRRVIQLDNGEALSCDLLLAADGARSAVRELAAMPVRTWPYKQQAIVTTVRHAEPHHYTAWQNFLVTGPLAFLPLQHKSCQYSSIVWSADTARAEALIAMDKDAFKWELDRASGGRLGQIEWTDKRYSFPLVQCHAVDYIAPQLALVGDAAHTIHPLAGQGVNLGLLDAQVMAEEIARAASRQLPLSDASILRRYQRQRKKHNLEVMLLMEGFKRLFGQRNLVLRRLRNGGLDWVNGIKPLKNWLARQAMSLD